MSMCPYFSVFLCPCACTAVFLGLSMSLSTSLSDCGVCTWGPGTTTPC